MKSFVSLLAFLAFSESAFALKCFSGPQVNPESYSYVESEGSLCVSGVVDCSKTNATLAVSTEYCKYYSTDKFFAAPPQAIKTCDDAKKYYGDMKYSFSSFSCCATDACNKPLLNKAYLACYDSSATANLRVSVGVNTTCYSLTANCANPSDINYVRCTDTQKQKGETVTVYGSSTSLNGVSCSSGQFKCCSSNYCNGNFGLNFNFNSSTPNGNNTDSSAVTATGAGAAVVALVLWGLL